MKRTMINTLKLILAATVAILFASAFKLNFTISAGIVAILTIQPTKKETLHTALGRVYAFGVAMLLAFVSFRMFGFTIGAFIFYLIPYFFICQLFKWNSAMVMHSVLVSHFVSIGAMDLAAIRNETLIFCIGVSVGIIANLHLRKKADYIAYLERETDAQIVKILRRMSERIMDKDITDYNGDCFKILKKRIHEAGELAEENFNNQFKTDDTFDIAYIAMRDKQCMVLYEMYKNVRMLHSSPITANKIAAFFAHMAEEFSKENDGRDLMAEFEEMDRYMKKQPLPNERQEFEDRARLFGLMRSVEEFMQIKMEFAQKFQIKHK